MSSEEAILHSDFHLYAVFLLKHIEDATEEYNRLSAEYGWGKLASATSTEGEPPLVSQLKAFLQALVDGKAMEYESQRLLEWRRSQSVATGQVAASAIQLLDGLLVKKLLLLQFLPYFTSDPGEHTHLSAQIEKFHHVLCKQLFEIGIQMQEAMLVEKQIDLEAITEELQASREEVKGGQQELQDTTEALSEANHSLIENKRIIEKITSNSTDFIYIFDLVLHKTVYASRNIFWDLLGISQDEFYALDREALKGIFYPGDYEKREQFYRDFLPIKEEEMLETVFRLRHGDGFYHTFLLRGTVFRRTPEGVPDQVVCISKDITQLKQTEADLSETLATLQDYNEELKQINLELADRKHFIEQVTNTIPSYIFIFDLDTFYASYFNRNLLQDLGYPLEEIREQGLAMIKKLFYPGDYDKRNHFYRDFKTVEGQEIREIELRLLHADGGYRSFLIRNTVFKRWPDGKPSQVIGVGQDITQLKQTEADLRDAMLQLQLSNEQATIANDKLLTASTELAARNYFIEKVAHAVPNTFFIVDIHSLQAVYVNREYIRTLGCTREQFYQLGVEEFRTRIHPQDYDAYFRFYRNFISAADKEVREINVRIRRSDGSYRSFLVSGSVFRRTEEGIPDQVLSISQDISQLKQTETELRQALFQFNEANEELTRTEETLKELNNELEDRISKSTLELAESNERFELVAQATNDAICDRIYGEDYIHWNQSFEQIFGYVSEEEQKNPTVDSWFERMYPEDRESIRQSLEQCIQAGNTSWGSEYRFLRSDGTYAYVLSRALILYDSQRKPHRLVGSMMDISHLKETELTLQKRNEELLKINNDLDNFIYVASHDLKHPVTNLEGLLAMLREHLRPQKDEESEKWLNLMDISTVRLKKTIQDIAEISKVQKGLEEAYEILEFTQVLEEIKIDIAYLISQAGATIITDFQAKEISYAHKNLRSILYNLLSNALKYRSPDRPAVVHLSTYWQDGNIVLAVKDNGLGLNSNQQAKLFTMFKRLHTHVEGTGIGLYMIKRIIENNGGKIFVTSESQVGTTFTIYFKPIFSHEKT